MAEGTRQAYPKRRGTRQSTGAWGFPGLFGNAAPIRAAREARGDQASTWPYNPRRAVSATIFEPCYVTRWATQGGFQAPRLSGSAHRPPGSVTRFLSIGSKINWRSRAPQGEISSPVPVRTYPAFLFCSRACRVCFPSRQASGWTEADHPPTQGPQTSAIYLC